MATLPRLVRCTPWHFAVRRLLAPLLPLAALLSGPTHAVAQCTWLPGPGFDLSASTTTNSRVLTLQVMTNGDLVAGGVFDHIGLIAASNIAQWNGASWSPLDSGTSDAVTAPAIAPNGDLLACGAFASAGGMAADHVARWNGVAWAPLGNGLPGGVPNGIAVLANGNVVAVGDDVQLWDGVTWTIVGQPTGGTAGFVKALGNDFVVAGAFADIGGVGAAHIARWSGGSWSTVGNALAGWSVSSLDALSNGDIKVGVWNYATFPPGAITGAIGTWNGAVWTFASTSGRTVVAVLPNDLLLYAVNVPPYGWIYEEGVSGSIGSVTSLFSASAVQALAGTSNGNRFVGGDFHSVAGSGSNGIAARLCGALAANGAYGTGCYDLIGSAYENLGGGTFDLSQSTVHFAFDGSSYSATWQPVAPSFATPTSGDLQLTDDDLSAPQALPFSFPYPGGAANSVLIGSNGCVFLDSGTTPWAFYGNVGYLLGDGPCFAPMWGDHDPATGTGAGTIHFDATGQAAYVTWLGVQQWGAPGTNSTFQLALFADGAVEFRYQDCAHFVDVLTGWSPGGGARDPGSSDVSTWNGLVCGRESLPLQHDAMSRPIIGTTTTLRTSNVPVNGILGATILGVTQFVPGVDLTFLGMAGCYLHASMDAFLTAVPAVGLFDYALAIPSNQALVGQHFYSQGIALAVGFNPFGFVSSNGVELLVGAL